MCSVTDVHFLLQVSTRVSTLLRTVSSSSSNIIQHNNFLNDLSLVNLIHSRVSQ
jgi:hypothetical protein